jgi:hypothetical protein
MWSASRHALTVGFLATMVFSVGQRILPAFCGTRLLFSTRLVFLSLLLLTGGCLLRVSSEILAHQDCWLGLVVAACIGDYGNDCCDAICRQSAVHVHVLSTVAADPADISEGSLLSRQSGKRSTKPETPVAIQRGDPQGRESLQSRLGAVGHCSWRNRRLGKAIRYCSSPPSLRLLSWRRSVYAVNWKYACSDWNNNAQL